MFFQRLEDLRIDADKTQQEIADLLKCRREVYRRYEKGIHEIPVWAVMELAKYYKVSTDYILGLSDKKEIPARFHGRILLCMLTIVSVSAMLMLTIVIKRSEEAGNMAKMVLSDGEWRIMNLLWKDAPLRVPEITERLRKETGWSRATVNMMLARLEEKGAVKSETLGRSKDFSPLLTQEEARGRETARFLDRLYEGSLGLMVSSLAGQKALSREEIRELYAILEKAEKEGEDA